MTATSGPCTEDDRYAAHLGIERLAADPACGKAAMTIEGRHVNDIGRAHGGALFSLADAAVALAANATPGERAVVTGATIQFTLPATIGDRLVATAVREFRLRRRAGYRVRVMCGDEIVAVGSGETLVVALEDVA